tara:strand:+ start:74453 stop:76474 length:2022 start_codon:yes stop_codon:yes gene_type:complete
MKNIKLLAASLLVSTAITGVAQAQTIDYGMMESIFGEPVTASATGKPQRASEAPVSMEIISQEEIRRSGARDIPQILRRVAGVQVQRSYNGRADVSIRGFNKPYANRLLILVNGRQVLSDSFGQANWAGLSIGMDEIRQIEVVKGPNTSLFGFNAESGVINIITFSPIQDDISQAQVKVGTQEHKEVNITHTAQFDNQAVRISAGELDADGFNRDSMTGMSAATSTVDKKNKNDWAGRRVNVDYEWQVNDASNFRAQVGHNTNNVRQMIPFAIPSRSNNDFDFAHLTYATQNKYGLWNANLYKVSNDSPSGTTGFENDLMVAKLDNLFKIGTDHSIRVAGEYRDNQLSGAIVGGVDDTFDLKLLAPSVMWDWKVSDQWNITNSVRYDHAAYTRNANTTFGPHTNANLFDRTIEEFSFNSAVSFKPTATDTFRASVSRGLHIPSLIELGGSTQVATTPTSLGFTGDPGLETERVMAYELAWDKKLPQHNMNFRSAVFMQKAENLLDNKVSVIAGPTVLLTFDNFGDSDTWGAEFGFDGVHNNWLRWGANYTYLNTDDQAGKGLLYEDAQPNHQVSLMAGFDHKNWEFDTDVHYISSYKSKLTNAASTITVEDIDAYFVVNARAGYNVNDNLNIAITGYNLAENHREWALGKISTGPSGANTLGRSVLANLTYKF